MGVNYAHKYHITCQHRCQLMHIQNEDMPYETARKYGLYVDFNRFLLLNIINIHGREKLNFRKYPAIHSNYSL